MLQSGILFTVLRSDFTSLQRSPRRWLHPMWEDFKSYVIMKSKYGRPWSKINASNIHCTDAAALPVHLFEKHPHLALNLYVIIQSQNLGLSQTEIWRWDYGQYERWREAYLLLATNFFRPLLSIKWEKKVSCLYLTCKVNGWCSVRKHNAMKACGGC
jgi:hypothetical protein